ncbi:MAG: hypothetical protein C0613_01875 [Desulfobulbaceae bacterium]|nr:MAG: hypothetical protein C0613_01875 [Desulfobulbaceae bacterium]
MTPPSENDAKIEPPVDLDDDLGDDWESAFQAEEFMFSPEEEPSDFFLFDENGADENEDIADLFADQQDKADTAGPGAAGAAGRQKEAEDIVEFPSRLQILTAAALQLITSRPRRQRLLIAGLPLLLLLIFISTLFFRNTSQELASREQAPAEKQEEVLPPTPPEESTTPPPEASPPPQDVAVPASEKITEKWELPTFTIAAADDNHNLIINIDLTLTAHLEQGEKLPEERRTFARDVIYQFFRNRPPYELKRYALARGDMITQLTAWLNKEWPDHPFDAISFRRYRVHSPSPAVSPELTFM